MAAFHNTNYEQDNNEVYQKIYGDNEISYYTYESQYHYGDKPDEAKPFEFAFIPSLPLSNKNIRRELDGSRTRYETDLPLVREHAYRQGLPPLTESKANGIQNPSEDHKKNPLCQQRFLKKILIMGSSGHHPTIEDVATYTFSPSGSWQTRREITGKL